MKIFFPLGAFYPSQIGGPCNTLYWHCCALKHNSVEPTVITTTVGIEKDKVVFDEWIKSDCGDVYYSTKGVFSFSTIKIISREIANTDILHLNSLFSAFSIYSFIYKSLFYPKKKIVWSVRGELNDNALKYSSWKKKPLLFLYKLFNKNIVYHSTSKQETEGIKKIFPKSKVISLPNLLSPSKRLDLQNSNDLLYVGRIHPIKSLHKLISALALSDVFMESSSKLFIVGKQEDRHNYYKEELESQIEELKLQNKIVFKGHLEGDDKEKMYASSYALILPSETENFGNVVVESLNQGTPVIASKGTPWEILEEYNAGLHVSNEPQKLAKAIDALLQLDKIEYKQMRLNSYKLVDENFKVDTQIHKWIEIYKNILDENTK
ncbi:MAG TPA: glycosyltransferase family 4 protein [Gallicola sp.]|nr:glycosyltransferase family 4 protein [Gallicola sp.]